MPKPKFRILSIDGGGIRGVIPCTILKFIEEQTGASIAETFDLVAGTSTGGIIALGLAKPGKDGVNAYSARDMLDMYVKEGDKIFSTRQNDFLSRLSSVSKVTKQLFQNVYESKNIDEILNVYFGEAKLSESLTNILITTYEIEKGKPFYFSSRLAKQHKKENIPLKKIARSTSAAPTYFEPSVVRYNENDNLAFVDGGVFANNPSILAYSEAKELWKRHIAKAFEAEVLADDNDFPFFMLSVGTGFTSKKIEFSEAKEWRSKDWIEPLLTNIFMRSVAESTHFIMQHLLPPYTDKTPRYERLDFEIPEKYSEMDNASKKNIKKLCELADDYIKANEDKLVAICDLL